MTEDKREKKLWIDMEFGEALERFVGTDPDELPENVKLRRSQKKAGSTKPPACKSDPKGGSRRGRNRQPR